jgi:glycosyltransferase involved in cell wall biosynthesis
MPSSLWDITIHTSASTPGAPDSLPPTADVRGLKVRRYHWNWWGYRPQFDWQKTDLLAFHNFDIFPHSWILIMAGIRKLLGLRVPKIFLTPHGGFTIATGWHTYPLWQRIIKKTYQNTLGVFLINHVVDGYRSVSAWEGEETKKNGVNPAKIHVITNGIEDEAYKNIDQLASDHIRQVVKDLGRYVLQIGRIHPIKNQATTVKALALLPQNINFAIVGPVTDSDYKNKLDCLIKEYHLENRVKFLGVVSGIDKYYLLKNCAVYTHMSTWESYCNTVHESMSQGCVSIVSKDTALEELVRDQISGFALPVFDFIAVAEKVKFIIDNPDSPLIRKVRRESIAYTQGHSWREISSQVEKVYSRLLCQK